jgi:hypothetical protein
MSAATTPQPGDPQPTPTPQPQPDPPAPQPQPQPDPPPAPQAAQVPPAPQAARVPDPPAQEPAAQPDNVVHLDVAQVSAARQRLDVEIAAACRVAKLPQLTEEMIASSMTLQQVQSELLRRMAAEVDRTPVVAIDPTNRPQDPARGSLSNLGREAFAARVAPQRR